jgi:penicillin-binding protein 1A
MENIPGVFGATYPALAWKAVMQTAIQGLPVTDFPMPAGLVQVAIDSKTGLLPGTGSPAGDVQYDVFVQGTAPTQYSISPTTDNSAGNSTKGASIPRGGKLHGASIPKGPAKHH